MPVFRNPLASRLRSNVQLNLTPSPERSIFVQQLLAKALQNNGRGSRSIAESADIASAPIIAALLAKDQQRAQQQQQTKQAALANQLLGGVMQKNIPLENLDGQPPDNFSVPSVGPSDPTRSAMAQAIAQNPQAMTALAMGQIAPPKSEPYTLGPGQVRFGPNGQPIAGVPAAPPQGTTDAQNYALAKQQGYKGSFVDYQEEIRKAGATNINPPTGYQWKPDGSLGIIPGGPADPANKPPNEVAQKNAQLISSLNDANDRIKAHEKAGLTDTSSMAQAALDSNPLTANFTNADYRKYKAAALQWSANLLYLKSGATANPSEIQNTWKEYFPQPNDPPEVRQAKAEARESELKNLRANFGGSKATVAAPGGWSITPVQ